MNIDFENNLLTVKIWIWNWLRSGPVSKAMCDQTGRRAIDGPASAERRVVSQTEPREVERRSKKRGARARKAPLAIIGANPTYADSSRRMAVCNGRACGRVLFIKDTDGR